MSQQGQKRRLLPELLVVLSTIAVLATVAGFVTLRMLGSAGDDGVKTIDFADVVEAPLVSAALEDPRQVLRVAVGAMNSPEATREQYGELLQLVAGEVGRRAVLAQRKTYAEINSMLEHREVDLAFVCTAPYVLGHEKFGLEILAVPVMQGRKVYHSYILAHQDSAIQSFEDLKGKVFAFTDPQSNTGCLVPRFMLHQRGETPQSFFSDYYYTHGHDNSIRAVAEGMADGAAVDSLVWDYLAESHPDWTSRTKVIDRSPPYGIPPVVVHPELEPELKGHLRRILLTLHKDETAQGALQALRIDRFEVADDSAYDSVRAMFRVLDDMKRDGP